MPLPLIPIILGTAAAGAAGYGVKKGIDAKNDMDLAKIYNEDAKGISKQAENLIQETKTTTTKSIEDLGLQKINILGTSISDFVTTFEKIKNIDLQNSQGLDELKHFNPNSPDFLSLKKVSMDAKEITINGLGALGSGALLAFGTYNVVMGGAGGLLVTATTGTALSSLTGVAATNATLAWLGGGALSAGGLGMAGGMAVLGGLVAGPALAVGGALFAKQAEKAYYDAKSNYEKAKAFKEQANAIQTQLNAIKLRADQLNELLQALNKPFIEYNADLRSIIRLSGVDWQNYRKSEKEIIYKCVQIAQTIKMVLDTSLLNENGELVKESEASYLKGKLLLTEL